MATRRQLIGAQIASSGQSLMDTFIQNYFHQQQAAQNDQMEKERTRISQEHSAELQRATQQQQYGLQHSLDLSNFQTQLAEKDPEAAMEGGISTIHGFPVKALVKSQAEKAGPAYESIKNAHSLAELPTEGTIRGLFASNKGDVEDQPIPNGQPGTQTQVTAQLPGQEALAGPAVQGPPPELQKLYAALKATGLNLQTQLTPTKVSGFNDKTQRMEDSFVPPNMLSSMKPVPQGPTPTEAGANAATIENAVGPAKARTAGLEQSARETATFDPKFVQARINEATQKAMMEAAAAGARENAVEVTKGNAAASTALMALNQLKPLYAQVAVDGGFGNDMTRTGRSIAHAVGPLGEGYVDPRAAELDRQADAYKMLLYRAFGGTAQGVSDTDLKFLSAGIPSSSTLKSIGNQVFHNSTVLLTYPPILRGRYGLLPFEQQRDIATKWAELNEQAAKVGATEFRDPFSKDPNATVPVVK